MIKISKLNTKVSLALNLKTIILTIGLLVLTTNITAQNVTINANETSSVESAQPPNMPPPDVFPYKFNYQGIIKDDGNVIANTDVTLLLFLQKEGVSVTLYQEEHVITTTNEGQFAVKIGEGTNQALALSTIDWSDGPYILNVFFQYTGVMGEPIDLGDVQLIAVPYAVHAKTAESLVGGGSGGITEETDPIYTAAPAATITSQNIADWNALEESGWAVATDTTSTTKFVGVGVTKPTALLHLENATLDNTNNRTLYVRSVNTAGGINDNIGVRVSTVSNSGSGVPNSAIYGIFSATTATTSDFSFGIEGQSSSNPNNNRGVQGLTNGTGSSNIGVRGQATGATTAGNNFGVLGYTENGTQSSIGVYGGAASQGLSNYGVYGISTGVSNNLNYGLYGFSSGAANSNYGVRGVANGTAIFNVGVHGRATTANNQSNVGLEGFAENSTLLNLGVFASTSGAASTNYALFARANGVSTTPGVINYGVYGEANGAPTNYAGFFAGDVTITGNLNVQGTLAKAGGTFKIDHPQDPTNKYLVHSFVESPEMMNVYSGNITTNAEGFSIVRLPSYFETANKDFRYQLTVIGTFARAIIKEKIANNTFIIQTDMPNVEVSWQVTGVRNDKWSNANRVVPEQEKTNKGTYLHPELFNVSKTKGENYIEKNEAIETLGKGNTEDNPNMGESIAKAGGKTKE